MRCLLIDTSTERGIIALSDGETLLFVKELPFGAAQSKFLMPYLSKELQAYASPASIIDVIGVGVGPGSYTGIRLGVSVAQTLAYSWKVPLVGVSSLSGFVPSDAKVPFAAVVDARIGGLYLQRSQEDPQICSLEEAAEQLKGVECLVTPAAETLRARLHKLYPEACWMWEEKGPCPKALLQSVERAFQTGKAVTPPEQLEIYYLRQTEAERQKATQNY